MFFVVKMLSKMTEYPEVAREEMAGYGNRMRLEMDNKSKSKNLDCAYVCEKVRNIRMSRNQSVGGIVYLVICDLKICVKISVSGKIIPTTCRGRRVV